MLIFQRSKPYYFTVLYVFHAIQITVFDIKSRVIVIDFEAYFGTKMLKNMPFSSINEHFSDTFECIKKSFFTDIIDVIFVLNYVFHAIELFRFYMKSNVIVKGIEAYFYTKQRVFFNK